MTVEGYLMRLFESDITLKKFFLFKIVGDHV